MNKFRYPIVRYSVKEAIEVIAKGGELSIQSKGNAELLDKNGYTIGFLTKAQVEKLNECKK